MQKVAGLDVCSGRFCTALGILEEEEGIVTPAWDEEIVCCVVLVG